MIWWAVCYRCWCWWLVGKWRELFPRFFFEVHWHMSQTKKIEWELLVIGYGNTLRSDDGVGPGVADAVSELSLPGVRSVACHQLTPELAHDVAQAGEVIFVDASVESIPRLQIRRLEPSAASQILAHAADPKTLLALARDVFGHCPPAWWLTIPVRNLEFGENFSADAAEGMHGAVRMIETLAADCRVRAKYAKNWATDVSPCSAP